MAKAHGGQPGGRAAVLDDRRGYITQSVLATMAPLLPGLPHLPSTPGYLRRTAVAAKVAANVAIAGMLTAIDFMFDTQSVSQARTQLIALGVAATVYVLAGPVAGGTIARRRHAHLHVAPTETEVLAESAAGIRRLDSMLRDERPGIQG